MLRYGYEETILLVDGQNLLNKIQEVVTGGSKNQFNPENIDYQRLFSTVLKGFALNAKKFYAAKIKRHPDTQAKSDELIEKQRRLKTKLEQQRFDFILSGTVRGNYVHNPKTHKPTLVFKEKGVDVAIAVDLVAAVCDGEVQTVILCSSDSDLQPAITEARKRGMEIVYLGFENSPNKGLTYTTNRTILFRNSEILDCYKK